MKNGANLQLPALSVLQEGSTHAPGGRGGARASSSSQPARPGLAPWGGGGGGAGRGAVLTLTAGETGNWRIYKDRHGTLGRRQNLTFQMRTVRPREGKQLASGHPANQGRARARAHISCLLPPARGQNYNRDFNMIHTTILSESLLLPEEAMTEKKKIQKDAPSTLKLMTDFTWSFIKGRNCEQGKQPCQGSRFCVK